LHQDLSFMGVNPGGWGCHDPRFWAGGCRGGHRGVLGGSWTGRETLLYLIMYM